MENQQSAPVVSTKDWFITVLVASIPIVGFIMLFVWAFSDGNNPSKSNWAKATLLWGAIAIVLVTILYVTIFAAIIAGMGMS